MNIAKLIDHTALAANSDKAMILKLLNEAKEHSFMSVCVNPTWVKLAAEKLTNTDVEVCTVIGFPLGASTTAVKAFETTDAIKNGATEIDMVINIAALIDKNDVYVEQDIEAVVNAAGKDALVKVIIETCLLSDEEKVRACELSVKAGADYVKTSTGFSTGGATVEDIALMRKTVGKGIGVKASGGVRTLEDVKKMVDTGASRIGASAGVAIVSSENE